MEEESVGFVPVPWLFSVCRLCNSVSFLLVMRPTSVKSSANSTVILLGCLAKPSFVLIVFCSWQNLKP